MKIKISTINLYLFIIAIIVQVDTVNYESAGLISYLKYIVCLLGIITSVAIMMIQHRKLVMTDDMKRLITVPIIFVFITVIKGIYVHTFSQRTVIEFLLMTIPIIYSYCLINTLSARQLEKAMMATLIVSFMGYLYNLGMSPNMIIKSLVASNFSASNSALESSQFAGISISLCLYYLYYRKNRTGAILSFIFVIFTFKRLAILTALVMLFLPKVFDVTKTVKKNTFRIIVAAVFACSVTYFWIMIPKNGQSIQNALNINLDEFTMGRFWRFSLLYNNPNYVNYGLGSTYTYLMKTRGFALEMDICRLMFEVTAIGVAIFVYQYFSVVRKNWYCTLLMMYLFFNMITSHCLVSMFSWLIIYMTIGSIQYLDNKCGVKVAFKIDKR